MKFLEKLYSLLKDVRTWIIIILGIISVCLYFNYKSLKSDYDNIIISNSDTLVTYKNKIGELYAEKKSYITDINNLKSVNNELYNEVKNLKDNPLVVTKTVFKTQIDSVYAVTDSIKFTGDSIIKSNFSYNDEWTHLAGYTEIDLSKTLSSTFFNTISFSSDLTLDFIEQKKNLCIIAKSSNPYLQINNLEGYIISPEQSKLLKKRFHKPWGVMVGVGPSTTIVDNKIKVYPSLQLTVGYKFISF